jgi:SecD/SecF fusion protein
LFFYDWEANLLDQNCRTDADENADEKQPITGFFQAVRQASRCDPQRDGNNSAADRPRFYAFDEVSKRALNHGQPSDTREAALEDLDDAERGRAQVVEVPEGILVVRDQKVRADAPEPDRFWVVQDNPALSGTDIRNPEQNFDQRLGNKPNVRFEFTDRGREAFQDITRAIAQRGSDNAFRAPGPQHFAIVLDDELVSAPSIDYVEYPDGIDGRKGAEISGSFTIDSAQDLAEILKIGALPVRLELVSRSQVSASLGQQALDRGLLAALAGFAIVVLFLLVFYRVLGVIASVTMAIYGLYLYAIVELVPIVLTLPGIAGMVLTLGVAADANIVIFERVKEEIRAGRSVEAAISAGYKKGLSAILDANIVTILVAFVLFVLATSEVRGFALTLGVGVIVSLFTAVLATQAILYALRGTRLLRSRAALGARDSKPIRFDFIGGSRWFFSMSGLILSICALAIATQGLNFGIDFEGGTRITAPLERAATVDQVRDTLAPLGLATEIQTVENRELGRHVVQINAEELGQSEVHRVEDTLRERFGFADEPSSQSIGASFGQTVAENAIRAIIASLIIISLYITVRFQWKFAVPALIALSHDLLITSGVYALTGREVTASTVAALLTILGFSLYDTIVVFDRVRENIPRMPNAAFSQIYNRSMSKVIVRSMATSFCATLPILALLLFGGDTLQDFAFALLVGTISGTYSSVFIAGPVLTHWKDREPVYQARETRIRAEFGTVAAYAAAPVAAFEPRKPRNRRHGRPR